MHMPRRTVLVSLMSWCLLASWLSFGCLELLEQVNLIPETAAEDQQGQDLDEAALLQLASGLKSAVPSLDIPCGAPRTNDCAQLARWLSFNTVHPLHPLDRVERQSPPSLRLHQQLSVYRF